jgi:hypothetical protein
MRLVLIALLVIGCGKSRSDEPSRHPGTAGSNAAVKSDRVATFWKWFVQHAVELRTDEDMQHAMERIGVELAKVDAGLIAEVAADGDARTLVISADGNPDLFPAVQRVYGSRPTKIDGWSVVAFRPRMKPGEEGFVLKFGDRELAARDLKFVATPAGKKLDIAVFVPGYTTREETGPVAYLLLDHVVGEYDMETKIGVIDFASIDEAPGAARPLNELASAVDALAEK